MTASSACWGAENLPFGWAVLGLVGVTAAAVAGLVAMAAPAAAVVAAGLATVTPCEFQ